MADSAYLGEPPLSPADAAVQRAIHALSGSLFFPDPELPYGEPKPSPDAPDDWSGGNILAAGVTFLTLVVIVTAGRFYIRWMKKVALGWDDAFVVPCVVVAIGFLSGLIWTVTSPYSCLGRHIYFCTYQQLSTMFLGIDILQAIFFISVYCAKMSILLLNRRISSLTQGYWNKFQYFLLGLIPVLGLFSFFVTAFPCNPVAVHFSLVVLGSTPPSDIHCLSATVQDQMQLANRAFHITTDLLLLSVPVVTLWRLHLPLHKKLGLCFLFCFGIMSVTASIMRCILFVSLPTDMTYAFFPVVFWDMLDLSSATMLTSLPVFYPVLDALFRKTRGRFSGPRRRSAYGSDVRGSSGIKSSRQSAGRSIQNMDTTSSMDHLDERHTEEGTDKMDEAGTESWNEPSVGIGMARTTDQKGSGGILRTDEIELREVWRDQKEEESWIGL